MAWTPEKFRDKFVPTPQKSETSASRHTLLLCARGTRRRIPNKFIHRPDGVSVLNPRADESSLPSSSCDNVSTATHEGTGRKRGPVPKRRFQKGSFQIQNGKAYTLFYKDVEKPDGAITTERARHLIGDLNAMSERAARREHDLFMAEINRRRGSVPVPIRGETFQDAVGAWKRDVAPQLSPATVRQRESYLRIHVLPVFGKEAPHALDVPQLQRFATSLQNDLSPKTIINILEAIFAVLRYAKKSGIRTSTVSFSDLTVREPETPEQAYFTSEQVGQIVGAAKEPYKTMFALASVMGARAGELMALTLPDLDFRRKTIRVNKSADDLTRMVRQPKTKKSVALLPMPSDLEAMLCDYLKKHWKENPNQLLFPAPRKEGYSRSRNNVVRSGLKPILRELGISAENVGLHAFRHGLATELAESEPITVLQTQMRHADVRTTLKVYAHVIPQSQRDCMERIAKRSIGTNVPIGTGVQT
jgi:integrase